MTLTPEQLDAIAVKLLGWKPLENGSIACLYSTMPGVESGPWRYLHQSSPADAMLVLEAMTREGFIFTLKGWPSGYRCSAVRNVCGADAISAWANGDTIPEAAFACAAKLVERM